MRTASIVLLALLVSGCAATQQTVAVDTFCMTAKKRTWDPDMDSVQTMREAVVWNRLIDRRCGVPGQKV